MGFADQLAKASNSSNLQDDENRHHTEVLGSSALADKSARDIGSLLHRVKYAGTVVGNLRHAAAERERLERERAAALRDKERIERKLASLKDALDASGAADTAAGGAVAAFRTLTKAWHGIVASKGKERQWLKAEDVSLAAILYRRVAETSLAHYLTGQRDVKSTPEHKLSGYEINLVEQMVSELEALESSHAGTASALLRRVA